MMIGRELEIGELRRSWNSGKFEFFVIYGRRRIGKTTLLREFSRDKRTIFLPAVKENEEANLAALSQEIFRLLNEEGTAPVFGTIQEALEAIFNLAQKERLLLVIDEFPYLAKSIPSFTSILQHQIDRNENDSQLFIILCGSSLSYMEDEVLSSKSPLYGRRTGQLKIQPFLFRDILRFHPDMKVEDLAVVYGIAGGIPQYLTLFNDSLSLEDNIREICLRPSSQILEEPDTLLKEEVRDPSSYNSIINVIARGKTKVNDISQAAGESEPFVSKCLKNLSIMGIVEKELPYGDNNPKAGIYKISDPMFRFWFQFIRPNLAYIVRGYADKAYSAIDRNLSTYIGFVFEEICREYLFEKSLHDDCPVSFLEIGRWWGNNPLKKQQTEIDIVARDDCGNALFGECKWTNSDVGMDVLKDLVEDSRIFHDLTCHYYVFAKRGFTKGCQDLAAKLPNVHLISFNQIVSELKQMNLEEYGCPNVSDENTL